MADMIILVHMNQDYLIMPSLQSYMLNITMVLCSWMRTTWLYVRIKKVTLLLKFTVESSGMLSSSTVCELRADM